MRRISRNPRKFDLFDLYAAIGREAKIPIMDVASVERIKSVIEADLKVHHSNESLFFGKRTEEMFGYIAAALGKCQVVKKEDSGGFVRDSEMQIPDYRLFLEDGRQYLVEVKNRHNDKVVFTEKYVGKLRKYADLNKLELLFAIYYSADNRWNLISPDKMNLVAGQYYLSTETSLSENQMGPILGDILIKAPEPLVLRITIDRNEPSSIIVRDGKKHVTGTVLEGKFFSEGVMIEDTIEEKIANFLYDNAPWVSEGLIAHLTQTGAVDYVEDVCWLRPSEGAAFSFLGILSSMLSSAYITTTSSNGRAIAIAPEADPGEFAIKIPPGFQGKVLKIAMYILQPGLTARPQEETQLEHSITLPLTA